MKLLSALFVISFCCISNTTDNIAHIPEKKTISLEGVITRNTQTKNALLLTVIWSQKNHTGDTNKKSYK